MADYTVQLDFSDVASQIAAALDDLESSVSVVIASQFYCAHCPSCGADDRYDPECPACMATLTTEALDAK